MSIPPKIHYCWFGHSDIPKNDLHCIKSWSKICPDYEIIEWNESNYDVTKNKYMKQAYDCGKWAFVSDYARLDILYHNGGIYMDTDVELLKRIDSFLVHQAFCGREQGGKIGLGLITGAEKGNAIIKELMDFYENKEFITANGEMNLTPIDEYTDAVLIPKGLILEDKLQTINGLQIYPSEYFSPIDFYSGLPKSKQALKRAYSIHHYHASWIPDDRRIYLEQTRRLAQKYGKKMFDSGKAAEIESFIADYKSIKNEHGLLRASGWAFRNLINKCKGK